MPASGLVFPAAMPGAPLHFDRHKPRNPYAAAEAGLRPHPLLVARVAQLRGTSDD